CFVGRSERDGRRGPGHAVNTSMWARSRHPCRSRSWTAPPIPLESATEPATRQFSANLPSGIAPRLLHRCAAPIQSLCRGRAVLSGVAPRTMSDRDVAIEPTRTCLRRVLGATPDSTARDHCTAIDWHRPHLYNRRFVDKWKSYVAHC